MPIRVSNAILVTTTATLVWANAAASGYICIFHPTLPICDNPQTPPPEFGHELPGIMVASTATATSTVSIVVSG
jgi:hypothetical protein